MSFESLTQSAAWLALGSTVVHFLWQGALIGLGTAAVLRVLRERSSEARYAVACGGLGLSLASFVATFAVLLSRSSATGAGALGALADADLVLAAEPAASFGAPALAAWVWALGLVVMATRAARQVVGARRLRSVAVTMPDPVWLRAFEGLKRELGVGDRVRLRASGMAEVPMVVGWLAPVVLVPLSAFSALSPDQLRSLLAHELAHVRRHDHLVNAIQAVVELVLFFHPAIWWISRELRAEREFCCDDSSLRVVKDARLVAEALAAMERLRITRPTSLSVLTADGGPLMQRITRILGVQPDERSARTTWQLPAGLALTGVLAMAGSAFAASLPEGDADAKKEREIVATEEAPAASLEEVRQLEMQFALDKLRAELEAAVEAGKLTERQAEERMKEQLVHLEFARAAEEIEAEMHEVRTAAETGALPAKKAKARMLELKRRMEAVHIEAQMRAIQSEMRRIEIALERGEVPKAEAKQRLADFSAKLADMRAGRREDPEAVVREIEAAVAAGKLTPEEGQEKLVAYQRRLDEMKLRVKKKADPEQVLLEIERAVAAGHLSPEEGKRRIEAVREKLAYERRSREADPEEVIREIQAAVEAGVMTTEEGKKRLADYERHLSQIHAMKQRQDQAELRQEIDAAIAAGKLSHEEGLKRLADYERRLAETKQLQRRQDEAAVEKEIKEAVAAGKLSREEGAAKIRAFRLQVAAHKVAAGEGDASKVKDELRAAAKAGKLSAEEAEVLIKRFEEDLAMLKKKAAADDRTRRRR